MSSPAPILVHGATGFTGKLVCALLAERGLPFAASGRSAEKLAPLASQFSCETAVIDLRDAETLTDAMRDRRVVLACAGPFVEIGEPVLASAARSGIAYADTTGEQRFVAEMATRYRATAEARGASIAPSLAYEVGPADWVAHEAARLLGEPPDTLNIAYLLESSRGYGGSTTRGTKLSAVRLIASGHSLQFVDGSLHDEALAFERWSVRAQSGSIVETISFPSPEAVLTPRHTKARTLRTFMAVGRSQAPILHRTGAILPRIVRGILPLAERVIARMPEGPVDEGRKASFEIVATATNGEKSATARVLGKDPYGLTAAIQVLFAERVLAGKVTAKGVISASEAISPEVAFSALQSAGLQVFSH